MSGASISVKLHPGPLGAPAADPGRDGRSGAVVCFGGVVRGDESGTPIEALAYEAYEPMTTTELRRLAEAIFTQHGLSRLAVEHSFGLVPVGRVSFRLRVWAPHRKPALSAMDGFIDRMKRDVPLWKAPVWSGSA